MRNRYLDLLRAAAIVRVVVYHLFGWPWLALLLPAMGIMFALAGSLTAASLDRRAAGKVIVSRLRRLLPPLWLLGIIVVPAMIYAGWAAQDGGDKPWSWKLALWVLPLGDPPGSSKGIDAWEPLWYIRAYLWFVLLSPLLYLAYKKISWAAVAAPIALLAVLDRTGLALPFGRADAAMWDFATYGACWIAGFAHHDGRLHRLRPGLVAAAAAVLGVAALYWLHGHAGEEGYDLNDVPEAQALWSLAFVLVALHWRPDMTWLSYARPLDRAVTLLNARAVTVYLWHNIAIAAIWPVLTVLALDDLGSLEGPVSLGATLALTGVAVLAFGWVEDLAARRRPRLWPASASPDPARHGEAGPVRHGEAGPVRHGEAGPVRHGEAGPVRHGEAGPVRHGEAGPVRHGEAGPVRHADAEPARQADAWPAPAWEGDGGPARHAGAAPGPAGASGGNVPAQPPAGASRAGSAEEPVVSWFAGGPERE